MLLCEDYKRTAGNGAQKENNLNTDRQEGIKAIDWNSYGKMSRLIKGTAQDDTLTMVFHYDGMGNRIRKDVWREAPGSSGGLQDRVSDIYVRDAQGNILAVYKEHARVNGGATIDWLNSHLHQVSSTTQVANFLSEQYGNNGNFTSNLYDYGLLEAAGWANALLSERSGRFYINQSDYMFGHALETQLVDSWSQLSQLKPTVFLPLLKDNAGDLGRTRTLLNAALQSSTVGFNTLEHLCRTDNDFMGALFMQLPDGYKTDFPEEVVELGTDKLIARLTQLMGAQGADPIGDAFVQAARVASPETFLTSWVYDNKIFNRTNLGNEGELKKGLKECIIRSENASALKSVRESFANWMEATLPHYVEEHFTPQDRLNVIYNSDKVVFLESYINGVGMAGITAGLVKIPGLTGLSYSNTILNSVGLGLINPAMLQYVNTPSPQNIDTDTLWLAEHHLYGSSRLGIKQYEPHQYRNIYSNTQSFVKGINVRQPWYSLGTEEMLKSGAKAVPLLPTHYLVDSFRYRRDLGTKYYELSDHLGNVLATVLDRKTGYGATNGEYVGFKADIASATDYYPFGMEMPGRSINSEHSRFGFNGMEKDNEVKGIGNSLDFGARMYDSRVGRFLSLDPDMQKYPFWSPYSYASNSPNYIADDGFGPTYKLNAMSYSSIAGKPVLTVILDIQIDVAIINQSNKKISLEDGHYMANLIRSQTKSGIFRGVISAADAKTYLDLLIKQDFLNSDAIQHLKKDYNNAEIRYEYNLTQNVRYAGTIDNVRANEEILVLTNGGSGRGAENGSASPTIGVMSIDFSRATTGFFKSINLSTKDNGAAHEMGHDIGMPDTYRGNYRPANLMGADGKNNNLTTEQFNQIFTSAILDIVYSRKSGGANMGNYSNSRGKKNAYGTYTPDYKMSKRDRVNLHFSNSE